MFSRERFTVIKHSLKGTVTIFCLGNLNKFLNIYIDAPSKDYSLSHDLALNINISTIRRMGMKSNIIRELVTKTNAIHKLAAKTNTARDRANLRYKQWNVLVLAAIKRIALVFDTN